MARRNPAATRRPRSRLSQARAKFGHNGDALGLAHRRPGGDLRGGSPAATHKADRESITQTLMQGVERVGTARYLGSRMPDEKSAPGGDLAALLRGAGDVAGLPANRAASKCDHA